MTTVNSEVPPPDDEISLLDLLLVLAENARLIVYGALSAGLVALGIAFAMTPIFTATNAILTPQQQQSTAAMLASQLGALVGLATPGGPGPDLYISLIKSRTVADRMIERFDLLRIYDEETRQDARETLEKATKVTASKEGLITIEVSDEEPMRAAQMANAYVEELSHLTDGLAITEAQQRRVFFEKQLHAAQQGLTKAQLALGEVGLPESLIKSSPIAVVEVIGQLRALVTGQEIKLSTMRGYLTEQSPEFRLAQRELESLRAQLAREERNQPATGGQGADYLNRFRDFKYQETLYELLAKQYETAKLDEAREGATIQVVDVAKPPERKSKPKRALIAIMATLATGALLALFAFVREAMRNARNAPESASKLTRILVGFRGLWGYVRK